jgi:hypothetical protein
MARLAGWILVDVPSAATDSKVCYHNCDDCPSAHSVHTGYAPLIKAYVSFLLSKLRFHRHHPEFNGLFEYEEYVSLKNIDDPNEGLVQAVGEC